ncbi:hypothetical protein OH818_23640 [Jiella pelagia]|uniref:Uncharacterized protein n=1 Tax=Jiella pelagia TaxID=2986949 RepID=A0ABY7C095_9HYPH|nr:hypothetical protein [Jiella pelagia]WAP68305.1 hypothetical protein OH818_23640 [Jiella pelagia]
MPKVDQPGHRGVHEFVRPEIGVGKLGHADRGAEAARRGILVEIAEAVEGRRHPLHAAAVQPGGVGEFGQAHARTFGAKCLQHPHRLFEGCDEMGVASLAGVGCHFALHTISSFKVVD